MNKKPSITQEAKQTFDQYINLIVCARLYKACKGYLFEGVSELDFACFLNIRPLEKPLTFFPKTKLLICYVINRTSKTLIGKERRREWVMNILERFDTPYSYYKSHTCEAERVDANKRFCEGVDNAVEKYVR